MNKYSICSCILFLHCTQLIPCAFPSPLPRKNSTQQAELVDLIATLEDGSTDSALARQLIKESIHDMYHQNAAGSMSTLRTFNGHDACLSLYCEALIQGFQKFRQKKINEQAIEGTKYIKD
jgi:hypothetical protein